MDYVQIFVAIAVALSPYSFGSTRNVTSFLSTLLTKRWLNISKWFLRDCVYLMWLKVLAFNPNMLAMLQTISSPFFQVRTLEEYFKLS